MQITNYEIISDVSTNNSRSLTYKLLYDDGHSDLLTTPLGDTANADLVLQKVVDNHNAKFVAWEQAELEASNFSPPIPTRYFLLLIPQTDRIALRELAKTNSVMEDAIKFLEADKIAYKHNAQTWLDSLVTAGVLQQALVDQIMSAWTANYG